MLETKVFFGSLDAFVIAVSAIIVAILSSIIAFSIRWMAVTPAQWLMYGTKAHGSVVITMKHDETVVLTPNEREEFATELKRRLNNLQNS
jgi:hypothetical protein